MSIPDGIRDEHHRPSSGFWRHASPASLLVLTGLVAAGLSGVAGGREVERRARGAGVELTARAPEVLRNGELFEMRFAVVSSRTVREPVVEIDEGLWEDMTVNTFMPAPAEESATVGRYRFTFAPLAAGDSLLIKVDLQVNPPIRGGNQGSVRVLDGEVTLVEMPLAIEVLP